MESSNEKRIHLQKDIKLLLYDILDKKKKSDICISPFRRYGMSGSGLYLIYFAEQEGGSLPYLLKTFEDAEKYSNEKQGMNLLDTQYRHTHFQDFDCKRGKLSGILLEYFCDTKKTNTPITLADILHTEDENLICDIISNVFRDFKLVYLNTEIEESVIKDNYNRYLRKDKTRKIIERLTSARKNKEEIIFNGQEITDPVYILDNLVEKTEITKSLIHGDFHQNNIVIIDNIIPRIIDFEWSCKNDVYIDFSILEMSVRYWKSPLMDYGTRNTLEKMFLCENIGDYKGENKEAQKIVAVVREIRKWCKECITKEKYNFESHLLSQFLVLYGLQAFTNEYNPFLVVPFLAKLGDEIKAKYVK